MADPSKTAADHDAAAGAADHHAEAVRIATERYERYAEQLKLAEERTRSLAQAMGDGSYLQHTEQLSRLNREYDANLARLNNQARAADLASGAYMRHARAMAAVTRESDRLARQEKLQQLYAQHGRFGGGIRAMAPHMQTLGMVGGIAAGALGVSAYRSGFQGTAEWMRFSNQWERLMRQFATIAIPVFKQIGDVVGEVAGFFESMSSEQQDFAMKIGLVVVGIGALASVVRLATVTGGALAGVFRVLTGTGSALATRQVGTAAVMTATAASTVGGVGGAAAGAGAAGAPRTPYLGLAAVGLAGHQMGYRNETIAAGMAANGIYRAGQAAWGGSRALGIAGSAARGAGKAFWPLAAIMGTIDGIGDGRTLSRSGWSNTGSVFGGIGSGLAKTVSFGMWDPFDIEEKDKALAAKKAEEEKKRRDLTGAGTGLLDAGGSAQAIQQRLLEKTALQNQGGEGMAKKMDVLIQVVKDAADLAAAQQQGIGPAAANVPP